jgi:hypothetical protein
MTAINRTFFRAAHTLAQTVTLSCILAASAFITSLPVSAQSTSPFLPPPPPVVSTVPSNGDVNPYGVLFIPEGLPSDGTLKAGNILVSNFNNVNNLQGTGTTIIRVGNDGKVTTFFQGKPGLGLTAALGIVKRGVVVVGNLPTADGTSATVKPGSLLLIDRDGRELGAVADPNLINGPWGMAIHDEDDTAQVFVSNVLNGTITRLDFVFSKDGEHVGIKKAVRIGSGFNHRLDPAALVLGPSGLFYDAHRDILYVASSADNAVFAINNAGSRSDYNEGTGRIIYQDNVHLHGPIDLVMTPNGHLITANSDGSNVDPNQPSELVEFTVDGEFVTQFSVDKNNGGAFGIGLTQISDDVVRFAAVDDNANSLSIFTKAVE